jgi:hypothetical protein
MSGRYADAARSAAAESAGVQSRAARLPLLDQTMGGAAFRTHGCMCSALGWLWTSAPSWPVAAIGATKTAERIPCSSATARAWRFSLRLTDAHTVTNLAPGTSKRSGESVGPDARSEAASGPISEDRARRRGDVCAQRTGGARAGDHGAALIQDHSPQPTVGWNQCQPDDSQLRKARYTGTFRTR